MNKRITLREIAREAGVSKTVVSAVLNDRTDRTVFVSDRRKKEIRGLIAKYGYRPLRSARALSLRRTNTIGLIINGLPPFLSRLTEEIQKSALRRGWDIAVYINGGDPAREEEHFDLLGDGRADGVIVSSFAPGTAARCLKYAAAPYNLKIVTISPPIGELPSVYFDEESAGADAARHLLAGGGKHLAYFGRNQLRQQGFVGLLRRENQECSLCLENSPDAISGEFNLGRNLAAEFLRRPNRPDSVFASNDDYACALLTEALAAGLRVPEDLAIVGCDNTDSCLRVFPSLTSLDINIPGLAEAALDKLVRSIEGQPVEARHTNVEHRLVARGSTRSAGENL